MNRVIGMSVSVALASTAAAGLAACAANPDISTPTSNSVEAQRSSANVASDPAIRGGMTSCTKAELAEAATAAAQVLDPDNVYTMDDLLCADGWAVTTGILANISDPSFGASTSFVFEQEGQLWVLQNKTKVCGTMPTATTAPSDATIPAELFITGCAAG